MGHISHTHPSSFPRTAHWEERHLRVAPDAFPKAEGHSAVDFQESEGPSPQVWR